MKHFSRTFRTLFNSQTISVSSKTARMRFGNNEYRLTPDQHDCVLDAHIVDDIRVPVGIVWEVDAANHPETY